MKLNLGCGNNKIAGYVNVDMFSECNPDVLCDLESLPWVWETGSVNEVIFNHSLEHIGSDPKVFLAIIKELYRVCTDGCVIKINVPHPRHDDFIDDPTHVRPITPALLSLFSKQANELVKKAGCANSPLATYLDVNFEVIQVNYVLDESYHSLYNAKKISDEDVVKMMREKNNVVKEYNIVMKAIK